jgi:kinesin family protein 1
MEAGEGNIKVVVRCRPLNSRGEFKLWPQSLTINDADWGSLCAELARGAKELVRMQGNQTFLDPPDLTTDKGTQQSRAIERKTMSFSFDKSYWSAGSRDAPEYCSQKTLYEDLGKELLDHGFAGFNACILACKSDVSLLFIERIS